MSFHLQSPLTFLFICSVSSGPSDEDWTIYKQMRGTTVLTNLIRPSTDVVHHVFMFAVTDVAAVWRGHLSSHRGIFCYEAEGLWVTMLQSASKMMLGSEESTRTLMWGSLAHMTNMWFCREKIIQEMGENFFFFFQVSPSTKSLPSTRKYCLGYFKGALHRFSTWWLVYSS